MVRLVLHKAVLSEEEIKIALYGRPLEEEQFAESLEADNPRFPLLARLKLKLSGLTVQRTLLWDRIKIRLTERFRHKKKGISAI